MIATNLQRHSTGYTSLNRLTGGGLIPGTVVLLSGEAGVGKSALLAQILCRVAADGGTALAVGTEEPLSAMRMRFERIGGDPAGSNLDLVATQDWATAWAAIARRRPNVVGLDSLPHFMGLTDERSDTVAHAVAVATAVRRVAWQEGWPYSPVILATAHVNRTNPERSGTEAIGEALHAHLRLARDGADVVVTCVRSEAGPVGGAARFCFAGAGPTLVEAAEESGCTPWPRGGGR